MITEEHLYLALETHRTAQEGSYIEQLALDTIIKYAANKLSEVDIYDDSTITNYVQKLVNDHMLDRMISEGILEEDFDGNLELTAKGIEAREAIRSNIDT